MSTAKLDTEIKYPQDPHNVQGSGVIKMFNVDQRQLNFLVLQKRCIELFTERSAS